LDFPKHMHPLARSVHMIPWKHYCFVSERSFRNEAKKSFGLGSTVRPARETSATGSTHDTTISLRRPRPYIRLMRLPMSNSTSSRTRRRAVLHDLMRYALGCFAAVRHAGVGAPLLSLIGLEDPCLTSGPRTMQRRQTPQEA
jgi:hypothetical protein